MSRVAWPQVPLRDVANQVHRKIQVEHETSYRTLGVRWWGEGAYERQTIFGSGTAAKTLNLVQQNDLIINKIWVRNGSVAVVDDRTDGCCGSGEFSTSELAKALIHPRWMHWYSKSRDLWDKCDALSQGTSGKNRIRPEKFLSIKIPLPPLPEQKRIVARIASLVAKINEARSLDIEIERKSTALLGSAFAKITRDAPLKKMEEVAPLVRRKAEITPESRFPELGVRCFGKGTFHKPMLDGASVGTKKLYSIEPGDLVFSNVFAWEGAVAVSKEKDRGRFGSHRFITCVPVPQIAMAEFLRFYFLTPAGLGKIGDASPGGAGRNRTLGLKKLAAFHIPCPKFEKQKVFCDLQARADLLRQERDLRTQKLTALIPSILDRAFNGEL